MALVFVLALGLAGCGPGPDPGALPRDVQMQLDALFGGQRVVEVKSLRRQGSSPMPDDQDDTARTIIYYNGTFTFVQPYDPADWSTLSPELIADVLGATDQGVIGFGGGPLAVGSEIRAYGSLVYRHEGGGWRPSASAAVAGPAAPSSDSMPGAAGPQSAELIARLAKIVDTTPGLQAADKRVVAEELDRALQNIRLRLDQGQEGLVIAGGPAGGSYARFVASLQTGIPDRAVTPATTAGSVENAIMIDRGEARWGLVQSDVAAAAVTGQGAFASSGPLRHLRALAALFPEPVHIVVREDSGIASIEQLAGRRIAIGGAGSGTRPTALQLLQVHRLEPTNLELVDTRTPREALDLLVTGKVDALIQVTAVPWADLATAARGHRLRLLALTPEAVAVLEGSVPGLVPLPIAARSYAGQQADVPTVAATALMVAHDAVPEASARRTLEFLFSPKLAADRGVSAARLSYANARTGVTLPLHEGAAKFYDEQAAASPRSKPVH
jgi:TRAP transporter TAXI family solute receptor